MKKIILQLAGSLLLAGGVHARADTARLAAHKAYTGARATQQHCNVVFQLDTYNPGMVKRLSPILNT